MVLVRAFQPVLCSLAAIRRCSLCVVVCFLRLRQTYMYRQGRLIMAQTLASLKMSQNQRLPPWLIKARSVVCPALPLSASMLLLALLLRSVSFARPCPRTSEPLLSFCLGCCSDHGGLPARGEFAARAGRLAGANGAGDRSQGES
jgi:hypothetical protein